MLSVTRPLGIDQCNCFTLRKAARQVTRFYDAYLEQTGLRITQFLTLAALAEVGSAAVNALAERLDIERTAMGKMVGFLEQDGLVTIEQSPIDRRARVIRLTQAGQQLHDQAAPLWHMAQRKFEELNGVDHVGSIRRGLAEIRADDPMNGTGHT